MSENRFSEFNESERSELMTALHIQRDHLYWQENNAADSDWRNIAEIRRKMIKKLIKELEKTFE